MSCHPLGLWQFICFDSTERCKNGLLRHLFYQPFRPRQPANTSNSLHHHHHHHPLVRWATMKLPDEAQSADNGLDTCNATLRDRDRPSPTHPPGLGEDDHLYRLTPLAVDPATTLERVPVLKQSHMRRQRFTGLERHAFARNCLRTLSHGLNRFRLCPLGTNARCPS